MKTSVHDRYTYRVTWSEEDQEHVGLCLEFPSLSWLASSPQAALKGIRSLVAETIADLQRNKEPVAPPLATRSYSGRFVVRVPPSRHRELVMEASAVGISLNRLVCDKLAD